MNAIAPVIQRTDAPVYGKDSIIFFEEGLVGFPECKNFVLKESEAITPFQVLECIDSDLNFIVIEPSLVRGNYHDRVPEREWASIGVTDHDKRVAFSIVIIGSTPEESTGNLQAPLLINYDSMTGKQVILMDSDFSVRQPLIQPVQ